MHAESNCCDGGNCQQVRVSEDNPESIVCTSFSIDSQQSRPSTQTPAFGVESSLVLVDVITKDRNSGLPIQDFQKKDFRFFDNRREVPITTFDSGAHENAKRDLIAARNPDLTHWIIRLLQQPGSSRQGRVNGHLEGGGVGIDVVGALLRSCVTLPESPALLLRGSRAEMTPSPTRFSQRGRSGTMSFPSPLLGLMGLYMGKNSPTPPPLGPAPPPRFGLDRPARGVFHCGRPRR
jgi:hypothetical protein